MLVIGGVLEAMEGAGDTCKLFLNKRRGFVKYALQHGRDMVPTFTFGENDLYNLVRFIVCMFLHRVSRLITSTNV